MFKRIYYKSKHLFHNYSTGKNYTRLGIQ
jgi:hypothetical protein